MIGANGWCRSNHLTKSWKLTSEPWGRSLTHDTSGSRMGLIDSDGAIPRRVCLVLKKLTTSKLGGKLRKMRSGRRCGPPTHGQKWPSFAGWWLEGEFSWGKTCNEEGSRDHLIVSCVLIRRRVWAISWMHALSHPSCGKNARNPLGEVIDAEGTQLNP